MNDQRYPAAVRGAICRRSVRRPALLVWSVLVWLVGACSAINPPPTPTPRPFAQYSAADVLAALTTAELSVVNPRLDMIVGRGAPGGFAERYIFEIAIRDIAPNGGQILVFTDPGEMQRWRDYLTAQRNSSDVATRRPWIYTWERENVILQVNANLTNDEAQAYRAALDGMPSR